MRNTIALTALVGVLALTGCAQSAPAPSTDPVADTAADEAAIRANTDRFLAAFNAADVAAIGELYASDVVQMRPIGDDLVGHDALLQALTEFFDEYDAQQSAVVDEVVVSGDIAIARGSWQVTQTPKAGGDTEERTGRWMVVSQRQDDGSWKGWRWIWSQMLEPDEDAAGG